MRTLVFLTQFFDCVDGVRGWFALQFAIVHLKLRFAFDRACEIEADGYGVKLLKDSGADPATLLAYVRTLPPPEDKEMSVYPSPAERIESAQKAIAALGR